jgi:hypothetical protein
MIDSEMRRAIQQEILRYVNVILPGVAQNATLDSSIGPCEDTYNYFPGQPVSLKRPSLKPYGFMSRAPDGTTQVSGRMGNDTGNRIVLGHRDQNAPNPDEVGEALIYSVGGYQVRCQNGDIEIGKNGVFEPCVMGEQLKQLFLVLLSALADHIHTDSTDEGVTGPPTNASTYTDLSSNYIQNDDILCKDGGRF